MKNKYFRVLTIAGSDSGGGAGIQADIKSISANGCYAMSVVTALTAQNTVGVSAIHPVPVDFVTAQIDAVLTDIGTDAVKIGMLFSPDLIRKVAASLQKFAISNIVLDPVMVATSGDRLVEDDALEALKKNIVPMAEIITPNLPEAEVLSGREITEEEDMEAAAEALCGLGCKNVLIKGGHFEGKYASDLLYLGEEKRTVALPAERIDTNNTHGTGCTLSSAIASGLAKGQGMELAVQNAKEYITGSIAAGAGYVIGRGHGPVHHFFRNW
ncbi:MAG: bifunctional hydroxymethylpyrimidine kinase/phosphomethylpyrimidine kinase [Desulfobulbus propionicus]|nr:MAG: bifunctional hydroxymethylpyrimidine kinase/phosphomethylpyrimidine kinase [Desulfobulbus propionicus]